MIKILNKVIQIQEMSKSMYNFEDPRRDLSMKMFSIHNITEHSFRIYAYSFVQQFQLGHWARLFVI